MHVLCANRTEQGDLSEMHQRITENLQNMTYEAEDVAYWLRVCWGIMWSPLCFGVFETVVCVFAPTVVIFRR